MASEPQLTKDYDRKIEQGSDTEDFQSQHQQTLESFADTEEERRLIRKFDLHILPITCLLYLFGSLDRSNLGNARLQGLPEDVLGGDKNGVLFDWMTSGFYFSYILVQIPACIISKTVPPRAFVAAAAIGWGTTSTFMATGFNFPSLMAARVILGIFEAGLAPVITVYMSLFYTKQELGLRLTLWFGFATVAGAFGGLIAFGVQHIHSSVQNWRLLFVIEGIPPIILGILTYFFLPNRPESTTVLNERERQIAMERMNRYMTADVGAVVNKAHIRSAFLDWRVYVAGVICFGLNTALASIGAFLPTIIQSFGHTNAIAQLLTVPPYVVSAVVMITFSFTSDRIQSRGVLMAVSSTIGAIGYLLLLVVHGNEHARYFATFCVTSGTYTTIGLIIAWFGHNLGSETKKATGIPLFIAIGQCGGILGSHLYPKTEGPRYIKGFAVGSGLLFLAAFCCVVLTISYRWDNARRDKLYGKPKPNTRVNTQELADKTPEFRYVP
ncbi:hypothetical protein CVT25_002580 [Psilocybe cyanescens]|uniref:Major facilitator superfamily (MFS) profile domain-containing protein n=1 Tax=Psilocybe cyanescens TaxID=93625 RepID=A0A409WL73_PSICY|nr:hypothetical protein CVT25_002580 [Psilocybe cyanescens]